MEPFKMQPTIRQINGYTPDPAFPAWVAAWLAPSRASSGLIHIVATINEG